MDRNFSATSFTLLILSVSIALLNCKASDNQPQEKTDLNTTVRSALGEKYEITYNSSKAYALCQQQPQDAHIERSFKYIVVRTSDNKIVKEGSFKLGYVKWQDEKSIEVKSSSSVRDEVGEKKIIPIDSEQR